LWDFPSSDQPIHDFCLKLLSSEAACNSPPHLLFKNWHIFNIFQFIGASLSFQDALKVMIVSSNGVDPVMETGSQLLTVL